MSRAYLCVSIDTECDKGGARERDRADGPPTFDAVHAGIVEKLQPLFATFGAKPTYLVSPDVIGDDRSVEALTAIGASCELGAHLDGEEPGDESAQLTTLTDAFIRRFQHQPVSFRGGRYGIGPETIGILERLGYGVESSVTPNVDRAFEAPTQPYRPDRSDPTRPGTSSVLEIPITIRRRVWNALPAIGRHIAPRWLRPTWTNAEALVRLAEDEVAEARRAAPGRPVVLHAVLQNGEVIARSNAATDARTILDRLRTLLAFAARESIAVVGLGDVPEILGA